MKFEENSPKIEFFSLSEQLTLALLNLNEFAEYYKLTDKRSIEKQAALYVAKATLKDNAAEVLYRESGKPYLESGVKISISHSYDWLTVLFSFNGAEVGIDIEKVRDKILNIKDKFLAKKELEHLKNAPPEKYTIYWGAKEAIYKALDIGGLIFAEQIFIKDFTYSHTGGKIYAVVHNLFEEKKHTLHYKVLDNYILVYTDNKIE
ncbi:MAG TPA: 4'-phosphopantetheinyl transferase superfamily protein [Bacteroidia bacterium]|nr:4'-phosphopantetheinyl transferase superfamily protein [Bacteroidia bacterium]